MNNKLIIGVIVTGIAVASIIFFATNIGNNNPPIVQNAGKYCSSDGTLTDTMPIQSHRSYCIKSDSEGKTYAINAPQEYSFSIIDDQGNTLKDFEITHTKKMHIIVARKDLAYFQHLHPEFNQATGQFRFTDLTFSDDGVYRIFADFAPMGGQKDSNGMPLPVTLSEDVSAGVGAAYAQKPLGSEERTKVFEGHQVALSSDEPIASGKETMISFDIKQNGKPVTDLQEYLGVLGHSVILRGGNLDFIHAHPVEKVDAKQNGKISFMVTFPEAGKYKIFTQFQREGKVFTTDFVVSVTAAAPGDSETIKNPMH